MQKALFVFLSAFALLLLCIFVSSQSVSACELVFVWLFLSTFNLLIKCELVWYIVTFSGFLPFVSRCSNSILCILSKTCHLPNLEAFRTSGKVLDRVPQASGDAFGVPSKVPGRGS